jgi:Kef-type K+ transport system membrane component KefB
MRLLLNEETEFNGVRIKYEDLYASLVFFLGTLMAGKLASKLMRAPALVGEIICGIILGPGLLNFVPLPESFVMLGELG